MNESTSTTADGPVVDPSEVQLHDYQFARKAAANPDHFMHEFVGALAYTTSLTPEGRKAWADALKAVQS